MKLVITGGLGFIGINLAQHIRRHHDGIHLIAIDWLENPSREECALFDHVHHGDFSAPDALPLLEGADAVVHLAACSSVQESLRDPAFCFRNNVAASFRLIDHMRRHARGAKLVFASTGGAIIGNSDAPIRETDPPRPISPYGASKLAVEGMISANAAAYGLNGVNLRLANVYGPHSRRQSGVVAEFCRAALGNGVLRINGDGRQTRDFIHADDVSRAVMEVIATDLRGTFNIGTGKAISILELVEIIERNAPEHVALKRVHRPASDGEVMHSCSDISLIREAIGYHPRIGLEEGIRDTMAWFRENERVIAAVAE